MRRKTADQSPLKKKQRLVGPWTDWSQRKFHSLISLKANGTADCTLSLLSKVQLSYALVIEHTVINIRCFLYVLFPGITHAVEEDFDQLSDDACGFFKSLTKPKCRTATPAYLNRTAALMHGMEADSFMVEKDITNID